MQEQSFDTHQAAQECLRMRQECGLAYAPVILFRVNGIVMLTAADSLRAAELPINDILEFVDRQEVPSCR